MVDFEGGKRGGFDAENGSNETFDAGSNEFQEAPVSYSPGTRFLVPDANGVVILPEGASLEDVTLQGGDLVITLADGSTFVFPDAVYVLPDGTIFVPQIVSEGVALDPTDVLDLLDPEGPGLPQLPTRSSGGNFEEDPGNIQDAFDLGNLLPYTELSRIVEEEEEVLPNEDSEPEVVIETPDNPVGVVNAIATVLEEGLPGRGDEPEGTNEPGSGELTSGTIVFVAQDGVSAIILNGVEIAAVGQEFVTDLGTLTITSIDLASGEIGFDYLLQDNTLDANSIDTFAVTVIDTTGDEADATLSVNIIDDAPIAFNDTANIAGGTFGPVTGNVVDNDVSGADDFPEGAAVTGFSNESGSADPSDTLQGEYGSLTLNADGSFSYSRDFDTPGGVEESFDYNIVDQDGSTSSATLLIVIGDAPAEITFVPQIGEGTEVDEAGLPPRGDEPVGSGEGADNDPDNNSDPSENTGATITFESPDGVDSITIDGTPIDVENLPQTIIVDGGTLVITDVTYDPETGDGTITYDFTLDDNTSGDDTTVEFDIEVTDLDGDTAEDTVVINVTDDVPEAIDDSATQSVENAPITVDAFANDIEGADGVELTAIAAVDGTLSGGGDLVYNDDGTFTYTPTPGEEGTVTFDYTITDGDGDVSTATVTIDLLPDSTPEIAVEGGDTVDEAGLPARGDEPAGSDEAADSETTSGVIVLDTGNDTVGSLVINDTDVTNGGTVTTDKGVLTVTLTDGEYSYSYELTDNTLSDPDTDAFELVVTDSDGDMASTDLVINIQDDTPTAVDDTDSLSEGGPVSTAGNVITDAEANGDNGADTTGADGAVVQNPGNIAGTYGELVLNADGSYTYTLTAFGISQLETLSDGEFFTEVFDYTLVDGDGDTDDATLTITLNGEDDIVTVNGLDNEVPEVSLDEDDLANVGDDQGSDQSDPLFQDGTFGVTSPDGLDDVQVNGVDVVVDGVFTAVEVANDGVYSVEVTGWTPVFAADGTTVISATFDYTATLLDNTLEHTGLDDAALVEMLNVTADDVDGSSDSAVLDVEIVDDTPTAVDDTDSLSEGGPVSTAGNVITDAEANGDNGADTTGADGAVVQNPGNIAGTYGELVLNADGSYTYTLTAFGISQLETLSDGEFFTEVFDYTLVDGDGDTDDATLTITLNGEDDIVTVNGLDNEVPEVSLDEDDLANVGDDQGSDQSDPLFQDGTFGVTSPDGLDDVQVNGVDVVVDGVFTAVEVANDGVYSVEVTGWTPVFAADGTTVISATFDYTATLLDNTLEHTGLDDAALVEMLNVTADDVDGSSDSAVLDVEIVDDTPTAVDDTDSLSEGGPVSTAGNVITDAEANGDNGADTTGADGAVVQNPGNIAGTYGELVLNADGSYTYTLTAFGISQLETLSDGEFFTEVFDYTLVDGDGDTDDATLTITLNGEDDIVTVNGLDNEVPEVSLDEDDLANVGDDQGSDQSDPLFQDGTFGVTSPDGLDDVQVNGVDVVVDGVFTAVEVANDGVYSVEVTGWTPVFAADGTTVISATFDYTATLLDNTLEHTGLDDAALVEMLNVTADDVDGSSDSAVLDVEIVDDTPTAVADVDSVTEDGPLVASGNVLTGVDLIVPDANTTDGNADTSGADGVTVTGVAAGDAGTDVAGNVLANVDGDYGAISIDADGNYIYALDNANPLVQGLDGTESVTDVFTYTITDGDGDTSTTTVTITVNGQDDPVVINGLDLNAPEETVDEDDLADGSSPDAPALTQDGTFTLDSQDGLATLTVGGVTIFGGGVTYPVTVTGDYGTIRITSVTPVTDANGDVTSATVAYEYELSDNTLDHSAATGEDQLVDSFEVIATDTDGSSDTASLDVAVIDDVPDATDNSNTVTEGGSVGGNVVSDDDGAGVDISGADGYATEGEVVSVRTQDGTVLDATPDGAGNYTVATALGTLTINQDGTYTYASNANTTNANVADTFIYTIRDGDGDESEAELVINIENVAGMVSDNDVDVDEKGLIDGTGELADGDANNQSDQSEVDSNGQITVVGATGTLVYTLTGANSDGDGTYGTLVLNSATGEYTYTLDTEFDHDTGNGRNVENAAEGFTYIVKDSLGNEIGTGTINVNITDDIPSIVVDNSGTAPDDLITQDADTIGVASDTASSDFTGAFTVSTEMFGADGPGTSGVTYAMTLTAAAGADSGLNSDGADIFLYQLADGTVVGSTAGVAPVAANDASVVFSIAVDANSGVVTLTQNDEIDHALPGEASNYDAQLAELADGLVGVTATGSITDNDGDTASESETVDLGGLVQFADDGPSIDAAVTDGDTVVLNTQDAETRGSDFDVDQSTANFSGAFSVGSSDFGADGAGSTAWDFSLEIVGTSGVLSNLSSDGDPVYLYKVGDIVIGSTQTPGGGVIDGTNIVFELSVDALSGVVTLEQYQELDHPLPGDDSNYDAQELALATGLVNLVGEATITDGDGDTASDTETLDLGGNIQFADDGPTINDAVLGTGVDVDETDGLTTSDTSAASIISFTSTFGADGAGTIAYAISIADANSGLATAVGDLPITLVQTSATTIEGQYNGGADTAFTVTINGDGTVTLEQEVALEHLTDGDNALGEHNDVLDLAGKINATVTVTDGDDDSASETVAIGSALQFLDDGPSAVLSGITDGLTVSDANFGADDSEDFSDAFTFNGGADGIDSTSYTLDTTNGAVSGLIDTVTGHQVFLFTEAGEIVGREGVNAADAETGAEVFTVSVTAGGTVELDQSRAVDHAFSTGSDGSSVTLASDGLIQLTGTVTDNDGDTASETLDIGSNLTFTDDVPTAGANDKVQIDDDALGGNAGGTGDDADADNTTGTLTHDFGNDGGSIAFGLTGAPADFQYITDGSDGVLIQQDQGSGFVTVVTVTLDAATGDYTVTQNANILHADGDNENNVEFTLGYTVFDGDTDTATSSIVINVDDDTPVANNSAEITGLVDEDGLLGGIDDDADLNDEPGAAVSDNGVVDSLFTAGADAPLTYGLDDSSTAALDALNLTSDGVDVTYTITGASVVAVAGATPIFTFTLNSDGEWAFNLEGPLDHEIAIDGENVNDIEIDFGSLIQATDADGDTVNATGSLTVTIDDDTPVANLDADIADEGETVVGNVLTNDLGGADGLESPAITGIGSTNEGTSDNTVTAGEFVLAGEFGTLTLNETTGDYSYDVPADSITVGGDDVFTYTIIDNDGDEVSTTLTFAVTPVNLSGNAPSVTVFEEAMDLVNDAGDVAASTVTGSAPTETTESDTGTVVVAGATEFGIQGGSSAGGFTTLVGIYGTIVIDEATGDFTYTLTSPLSTTPGVDDGVTTNIGETFTYTAQDADGNGTTGIIFINVVDDVPTAAISAAGLALAHDETVGVQGDAQDVAGPLAAFAGVSNAGDDPDVAGTVIGYAQDLSGLLVGTASVFGADGAGTGEFSLAVSASGVDSGLNTTEGTDIVLYKEGDLIVGRVGDQSGEAAFAIAIDASTGAVSMVQYLSVFNPIGGTSSPDEAVSIAAGAVQAVLTVTDGDGDASSASTNIGGAISFQDDAGTLGAFNDLDLVNAANAMDFGTFAYDTGADGHVQFNITGPALDGVLYQPLDHGLVDATDDGVNNPVNGTTLTATTLDGSETLFTLSLDENGNSKFTLVTPDAGSTEVIDLTALAAAGPTPFNETTDGRIEFSSTTGGVNSSTPGFGVANQFVGNGQQFQVEFHNPGTVGDDATLANAEFFNSAQLENNRDGGNVVYQITIFNDADGTSEVVYTGQILGSVTDIVPITLTEFNRFEVEGIGGGGQGARFSTLSLTKSVLPQDLNLDFNVTAIDGDFDFTSTQVINVEVDASAPAMAAASSGSATTASAFTTTALLDDGSDIGGTGGSGGLLGGGTTSFSNDNDLMMQTALRGLGSTQIAAAGFGAMMVNFSEMTDGVGNLSVTDGSGFQGFAETSYELASFEAIDSGFNSVVELPQATGDLSLFASTSMTQFDSVEFTGMNPMADASVRGFEFGGSSDFVSDIYAGPMSGTVGTPDVGADMEALLSLSDDGVAAVDLADASGLRGDQDIADITVAIEEIVNDIMAEGAVDTMIEHFAGEATGFTGEMGYLGDNALAQSIDGGAFTFGASTVADMTEDAAAMAVVHA